MFRAARDEGWDDQIEQLREALTPWRQRERVFTLGCQVISHERRGIPLSREEMARLAQVSVDKVSRYLSILGLVLPSLFPGFVDQRDVQIAQVFAGREELWRRIGVLLRRTCRRRKQMLVLRELLASRYAIPRGRTPDAATIAALAGLTDVAGVLGEMRNEEKQLALELEFGDHRERWFRGVARLRETFTGEKFDVAGEVVIGLLRGSEPTAAMISDWTGVPRATVARWRVAVSDGGHGTHLLGMALRGAGQPPVGAPGTRILEGADGE
jgi:hypothetical protein